MGNTLAFDPNRPRERPSQLQTHTLKTSRGDTVPAFYGELDRSRPLLFFCHGNADDLDNLVSTVAGEMARRLRLNLYAFEYPGYSGTRGPDTRPSEAALFAAAEAALDDAEARGYARERIIVYGKSLGSAVATHVAVVRPRVAALVLVSGIESIFRVALDTALTLPADAFVTVDMIGRQMSPTLIVHGTEDALSNFYAAERLYGAAVMRGHGTRTFPICALVGAGHIFERDSAGRFTPYFDQLVACVDERVVAQLI